MIHLIKTIFQKAGLLISKKHPIETKAYELFNKYSHYTMIPKIIFIENLKIVYDFSKIKGCVVECGVWRGGMSAGMAEVLPNRKFYLFDSFEGLPKAKEIDGDSAIAWQKNLKGINYHNNCTAEIEFAEKAMQMAESNYELIKGWFNETLPIVKLDSPIAILRLDGDWYDSTMDCLKYLYPKVAKGGIIILDDYFTWDGCSRAVHDYLSQIKSTSKIHKSTNGVSFIIK